MVPGSVLCLDIAIGQVTGGTISNGQGCYGASLLLDTFKKILLTLAEDRC